MRPSHDGIDLLLAYHVKVRRQLENLRAIAVDVSGGPPETWLRARRLATEVVAVLGKEGTLHAAQEGEILIPRLRAALTAADDPERAALKAVQADHAELGQLWARVHAWLCLLGMPDAGFEARPFAEACEALARGYGEHLDFEERVLFPVARARLGEATLRALAGEMRASQERVAPLLFAAP